MNELRPRQLKAIADLKAAYAKGYRAPLLVAPTGFGKTHTCVSIIESALKRGRTVWFLAHLHEILEDTARRLENAGIAHGHIRAGHKPDYDQPVQVVSVQTAARRKTPKPDLIIIDECHLAVAKTYRIVVEQAGNPLLLGLTGTPERLDGKGLGEVFDCLVHTCTTGELIAEVLLSRVQVYSFPPPPGLSKVGIIAGDYDQSKAAILLNQPVIVGDALDHWDRLCHGRRGVAFCTTVEHAESVAEEWRNAGYRAVAVSGGSDDAERREAIQGLRAHRLDLVACAQLWIAGVDVPEIDAVVWLRPTKSVTAWLQGIGRGLRIASGKKNLIIMDHVGNTHCLGFPTDKREWSLEGRKKKQVQVAPSVKTCPNCFAAMPTLLQVCPACAHEFSVSDNLIPPTVDGSLTLVVPPEYRIGMPVSVRGADMDIIAKMNYELPDRFNGTWYIASKPNIVGWVQVARSKYFPDHGVYWLHLDWLYPVTNHRPQRPSAEARSLEELKLIARKLGYKPGWAHHVYAARSR